MKTIVYCLQIQVIHPNLITPIRNCQSNEERMWNNHHFGIKSAVGTYLKLLKILISVKRSLAFQKIVLMVIYQIVAIKMKQNPLRYPIGTQKKFKK